jgi:hypothetical protein
LPSILHISHISHILARKTMQETMQAIKKDPAEAGLLFLFVFGRFFFRLDDVRVSVFTRSIDQPLGDDIRHHRTERENQAGNCFAVGRRVLKETNQTDHQTGDGKPEFARR